MSVFSKQTVALIMKRAQNRCERCGDPVQGDRGFHWSIHHREPRGQGGSKLAHLGAASNGVLLCGSGVTGCHGWVERNRQLATVQGFLVSRLGRSRPAETMLSHGLFGIVFLHDDGTFTKVERKKK